MMSAISKTNKKNPRELKMEEGSATQIRRYYYALSLNDRTNKIIGSLHLTLLFIFIIHAFE
jgi:hypothetical protein